MLKIIPLLLTLFICNILTAQEQTETKNKPAVSLTLIPPSPVTDQIMLDIRAGIRNETASPKVYTVSFYLDEEKIGNLLNQSKITVNSLVAKAVKFRWSTKNKAGPHKVILVCKNGKKTFRSTQDISIISYAIRSTKQIDGAWINFYHWSDEEGKHWNPDIKKMTDDQWRELISAQHKLEMNVIVMQELFRNQVYVDSQTIERDGYKGRAFYPSELYPERMPIAAKDPVEAVLSEADKNNMHVFVAVGLYAWFDFTKGSLDWHKKIAKELWDKYGHHPSFYGWYVSEEMDGGLGDEKHRTQIVDFFASFSKYVKTLAPEKPVMLATNSHSVRNAKATYAKLLPHLDILCPFGFHRMPKTDYTGEEVAAVLQKLCDDAGAHLWMDMEVFDFEKGAPGTLDALVPRPIKGLLSDLHRFPNFEKILCYQYPGLMNSPDMSIKPGGENTVKLFMDYKKYLTDLQTSRK